MLRSIIVGAGRIGIGTEDFQYTHLKAYQALADRVRLEAVVDPVTVNRLKALEAGVPRAYETLDEALEKERPEIVSICTPPTVRREILAPLLSCPSIKGIWCEKPFGMVSIPWPLPVQVNYIRRFDPIHQELGTSVDFERELFVIAKRDIHTVCHFTDLAVMWYIKTPTLHYYSFNGPCSYFLRTHYPNGIQDRFFPLGGLSDAQACMNAALENLLDSVDADGELISPACWSLVESESWADDIIRG